MKCNFLVTEGQTGSNLPLINKVIHNERKCGRGLHINCDY